MRSYILVFDVAVINTHIKIICNRSFCLRFSYYAIFPLAVHWLILVVTIFLIERSDGGGLGKSLLFSLSSACSSLFHSAKNGLPTRRPTLEVKVGYFFLTLTTIILVTLSLAIEMPDIPNMDVLQPVAIASVAGALPVSICFYFCVAIYDDNIR